MKAEEINTHDDASNDRYVAVEAAAQIVCACAPQIGGAKLGETFTEVFTSVMNALGANAAPQQEPRKDPAVNPKKSIHPSYIICLEDGKKFKSLKRHIMTHYNLTPEAYREKWGLAPDYPMVAPEYAAQRSQLAKDMGLGRKPHQRAGRKQKSAAAH